MRRIDKVIHRIKVWLFGATYTAWVPGVKPPEPMSEETMLKAYREMIDAGVIKYGEHVYIETRKMPGVGK